jgi:hypothetical protein
VSRLPDFLVIGAQKCGTTTLYEDLRCNPEISIAEKESSGLFGATSAAEYAATFPFGSRLVGEVATTYSMRPEADVVDRAAEFVPTAKILYIVREPISRTISHHHHDFALRLVGPDIEEALRLRPSLVQNSRYATQLKPWLDRFGPDRVKVIRFEDYVLCRRLAVADVCDFLGAMPHTFDDSAVHNSADDKVVAIGGWKHLAQNSVYRQLIRPLISERTRRRLMYRMLPPPPPRPSPPSRKVLEWLVAELRPEVERLAELLGTEPWWDLPALFNAEEEKY